VYAGLFWRNPQFGVTISSPSQDDKDQVTHMVVSLMQESLRMDQNFSIGIMIYKVIPVRWHFSSAGYGPAELVVWSGVDWELGSGRL